LPGTPQNANQSGEKTMFLAAMFGAIVAVAFEPEIKIIKMICVFTIEKIAEKIFNKKQKRWAIDI
jgi:hypothetical protein